MGLHNLFAQNSNRPILLLDIGSESVGGALICQNSHHGYDTVASHREYISPGLERHPKRLLSRVLAAVKETCTFLDKERHKKSLSVPHKTSILILPPWYIAMTRIIHANYEKNTTITERVIEKLINDETANIRKSIDTEDKGDLMPLEQKILEFRLNGYELENPLSKEAKKLEMLLLMSMTTGDFEKKVEEIVHRVFSATDLHYATLPTIASIGTRDLINKHSYIIIEVSGEITELILIRNGVVVETVSFPSGRNDLLRSIARNLKTDALKVAASRLKLTGEGKLPTADIKAYKEFADRWQFLFHKSLSYLGEQAFVPRTACLINHDEATGSFFQEIITKEKFSQFSPDEDSMTLVLLSDVLSSIGEDILMQLHKRAFHQSLSLSTQSPVMVNSNV